MKLTVLSILLAVVTSPTRGQVNDMTERQVLSGRVTILIPKLFILMDAETLALKYPISGHRPSEVYTNVKGTINVALNHTKNSVSDASLPDVKKAMEQQFQRSGLTVIRTDLKELNGSKFVILEFLSSAVDTRIYNLMAVGNLENRLVMITFNCTEAERDQWETFGTEIIGSIKLKKL